MRWLFWEIRKKRKVGPILNVCFTKVSFNRKSTGFVFCPNMIRPALQFWLLFVIFYSLKYTIANLDQNMWHLQLDFRHNCFLPIHHGHTQKERSRFRCIALHLATRYCLLDWQWWDLHCMQRLLHNPGTDKQLRHLTYPILHHRLSSRPQRRKLQLGPLLHLVLPLNELKMNFNIFLVPSLVLTESNSHWGFCILVLRLVCGWSVTKLLTTTFLWWCSTRCISSV